MAPHGSHQKLMPLRVITTRIDITSTDRLAHVAPLLAADLSRSAECYVAAQSDRSEGAVLINKLKAQIGSFLKHDADAAKYAAIVLIKSLIEIGGYTVLQESGNWIVRLVEILKVSDVNGLQSTGLAFGTLLFSNPQFVKSLLDAFDHFVQETDGSRGPNRMSIKNYRS